MTGVVPVGQRPHWPDAASYPFALHEETPGEVGVAMARFRGSDAAAT